MSYEEIMDEVEEAIESGTSLMMEDLNEEAQAIIRARHPDGDLPLPSAADFEE